jgi:hypothetical protein
MQDLIIDKYFEVTFVPKQIKSETWRYGF